MKTLLLSIALVLSVLVIGAVSYIKLNPTKVDVVSENINIPKFIDEYMSSEKRLAFISSDSISVDNRLSKLGFSSKSSNIGKDIASKVKTLYTIYDSIYPNNQFINFKCMNEIVKKYGLSYGFVSEYICDVPTSKITEMESFKSNYLYNRNNWFVIGDLAYTSEELAAMSYGYGSLSGYIDSIYTYANKNSKFYTRNKNLSQDKNVINYSLNRAKYEDSTSISQFLIIAPSTCFKGDPNANGSYGKLKDPIVLEPVFGGYIIVTSW